MEGMREKGGSAERREKTREREGGEGEQGDNWEGRKTYEKR